MGKTMTQMFNQKLLVAADLEKFLETNPITLSYCDIWAANAGAIEEQICMAKAYLSKKDCVTAGKWALKVFNQDKGNVENKPILDLLGKFLAYGECVHHDE
jgi:hypothetical protein